MPLVFLTRKNNFTQRKRKYSKLAPIVWEASPIEKDMRSGFKIDQFSLNLDDTTLALANSFLDKCDGQSYKSEGTRSRELNALLDRLLDAHNVWDNFHHEVPIARQIKSYINEETCILPSARDKLIKSVLICRIEMESGTAKVSLQELNQYINEFIRLFNQVKLINSKTSKRSRNVSTFDFQVNCILHKLQELLGLINLI